MFPKQLCDPCQHLYGWSRSYWLVSRDSFWKSLEAAIKKTRKEAQQREAGKRIMLVGLNTADYDHYQVNEPSAAPTVEKRLFLTGCFFSVSRVCSFSLTTLLSLASAVC